MRKSKYTEEQIVKVLREVDSGAKVQDVVRRLGITETTFYRWKSKYGGLEVSDVKRLKGPRGREPEAEDPGRRPDPRQAGAAAPSRKKMVGPAALRLAVDELEAKYAMKKRRACRVVGLAPSTLYYHSTRPERADIRARLRDLASQRPRWGYRRLHVLLHREGHRLNHKLVFRLYRSEGLAVRRKRRKQMTAYLRVVPPPPTRPRQQ